MDFKQLYIGIDPGKNGGIAVLDQGGQLVDLFKMPDTPRDLANSLAEYATSGKVRAVVEKVHAMPGNGVTSMFTFGYGYGLIIGTLATLGVPYTLVPPKQWQRSLGCGMDKTEAKAEHKRKLKELAQGLWPKAKITLATADAPLIAEWGRRAGL